MNIIKRLYNISRAETHDLYSDSDSPFQHTTAENYNIEPDIQEHLQSLTEIIAFAIKAKNEVKQNNIKATECELKAVSFINQGQSGDLPLYQSDALAREALKLRDEYQKQANKAKFELQNHIIKIETHINQLKQEELHSGYCYDITTYNKDMNEELDSMLDTDEAHSIDALNELKAKIGNFK